MLLKTKQQNKTKQNKTKQNKKNKNKNKQTKHWSGAKTTKAYPFKDIALLCDF